jgi:hypothetical protein
MVGKRTRVDYMKQPKGTVEPNMELEAESLECLQAVLSIEAFDFTSWILEYERGCPIHRWDGEELGVRRNAEPMVAQHVL